MRAVYPHAQNKAAAAPEAIAEATESTQFSGDTVPETVETEVVEVGMDEEEEV